MRAISPVTMLPVCLSVVFAFGISSNSRAQVDSKYSRPSLKGLRGVKVVVEAIRREAERDGLSRRTIQTNTELLLRKHGIRVLDREAWLREPGMPYLYVQVSVYKSPRIAGLYAYSVDIELVQEVGLTRDNGIKVNAVTWKAVGSTGVVGAMQLRTLYETVDDEAKTFVNAYLSQNGKR